jgi:hypothetical protein
MRAGAVLALLLLSSLAFAQQRELVARDWRLHYWPGQEATVQEVSQAAQSSLPRLRAVLGLEKTAPIEIYLVHTRDEFTQLTDGSSPDLVRGEAFPERRTIVIQPYSGASLRDLVAHELTHVLLYDRVGGEDQAIPRWLHEGVAKYAAEDFGPTDRMILTDAINGGRFIPLDQLEAAFSGPQEQVSVAYAEAYTLVDFLARQDPQRGLAPFLEQLALVGEVPRALLRTYGEPEDVLAQRWQETIRGEYLGKSNEESATPLIWGGLVVIFLAAYLVQLRRRVHIRRRLDAEEESLSHHANLRHHGHHGMRR